MPNFLLNSTPQTPNPKTQTPNPKPHTPHPTPHTLHPTFIYSDRLAKENKNYGHDPYRKNLSPSFEARYSYPGGKHLG
ncbi:MAG: hypothetical protein F6J93_14090 [Oscillatoria sp. SIO1A7]|nr:hypothetical protein [Oscillatoria sp. SIO1A7]